VRGEQHVFDGGRGRHGLAVADVERQVEREGLARRRVAASPPADRELVLQSVSCASNTACLAVGSLGLEAPYAERWNRGKWSVIAAPIAAGVSRLSSVSCIRPGACYAVGGSLMQYWNGSTWSAVTDAR